MKKNITVEVKSEGAVVYLLHFSEPYRHARHYIGYAENLEIRLAEHKNGNGARLMQVIRENGITFSLARIWTGKDRRFERQLKNRRCAPRYCPICRKKNRRKEK